MASNGAPGEQPTDKEAVGHQIRSRRTALGLSLRELGERSGLSVGFLSQVERGMSSLALGSLASVARALEVDVADLFGGERRTGEDKHHDEGIVHVSRADEPTDFAIDATVRRYRLLSGSYERVLEPMIVTILPVNTRDEVLRSQVGEKFMYVLDGELIYIIDDTEYVLRSGDSIHHSAAVPHAFVNETDRVVTALTVVTPPII
jgi:transcriptional regulator with XRE-family HTH domain